ncbi:MAG: hypothetical protein J07HQW1_01446 [Haloquadratum walsbyi J07HQW1]|uniref:Uncharacterized protein n=1 Tax=Haloquadratum walsbyi J07HQW1 TaxID=1238424 RepID=U1PCW7_9EURY|nr:MAG: hypothetical protein J07HQW1_01446 [Haloquadratum walsbyi J07HQW1]
MTRRQLLIATAAASTVGAGVTATQGLTVASVDGQVDVQSEQALSVTNIEVRGSDASFSRIGDDNTSLQVAVESNVGDTFEIIPTIENSGANSLAVRFSFDIPADIQITAIQFQNGNGSNIVQSDVEEYVAKIPGKSTQDISIEFNIEDTAQPGSKDISVNVDPLSTDE